MAKSTIKGITIKVGGDTTELKKALAGVNSDAKNLQSEMKQVSRLLKLDPSSTVLLTQKQKVLNEEIANTKDKLNQLKSAQSQVEEQFKNGDIGEEQYRAFQREIVETQNKLKDLEKEARQAGSVLGTHMQQAGEKIESAGHKISDTGQKLLPVTGAIAGIGVASAKTAADFETSMSQTAGALDVPMSKMENLRQLALKMGADTQFSAEEAGQAMTELAKGGLTEADIEGGALQSTMDLAASSSMDLGNAANTVVQVMGGFGLKAKDSAQAVNALAGAAAASSTDVEPLTQGLSQCAAQAHTVGWSIQDTTAILGAFADAGIEGSDAGTSLKTMLQRLGAPTDTAAKTIKALGLNIWTSSGHMKDASGIAQELQNKLGKLSDQQQQQALATIFGSDASRAATVLMNDGAAGLTKYIKATNDQTAAQRLANSQMGTSAKTWEQMKGSLETAAIQIGTAILPVINNIVGKITELTNKFSSLSPKMQDMVIKAGLIAGALAPVLIIFGQMTTGFGAITKGIGKTITAVKDFHSALSGGASLAKALSAALSPAGAVIAAIIAITAAVAALVIGFKHLYDTNANFRNGVNTIWNGIKSTITTVVNAIVGFFKNTIPAAWNGLVAIFNAVPAWWNGLWTQVGQFFTTTWNGIKSVASGIGSFFTGIWNSITTTAQAAWNGIVSFFTQGIPAFIAQAGEWFKQLPYNLGEALGTAAAAVVNFGVDVWNWVTTELPKIIKGIIDWFAQLPSKIWNFLVQVVTNIGKWGTNMYNSAVTWTANTINAIGTWFSQLPSRIWTWLVTTVNNIKTWGTNMHAAATTATTNTINAVVNFFSQLPSKIWTFLTTIVGNVKTWGSNMYTTAQTAVSNVVHGIITWFSDLPHQMLTIGENIVKGIWDGINGAIGWLHDRISEFCTGIVDGFKKNLKIHSPSQVFADEIGKYMALGIGQGFTNNMANVSKQMQAAIPTNFDLSIGTAIRGINGLSSLPTATNINNSRTENKSTITTPIQFTINQGNITVQGNADQNAIQKIKNSQQKQIDELKKWQDDFEREMAMLPLKIMQMSTSNDLR